MCYVTWMIRRWIRQQAELPNECVHTRRFTIQVSIRLAWSSNLARWCHVRLKIRSTENWSSSTWSPSLLQHDLEVTTPNVHLFRICLMVPGYSIGIRIHGNNSFGAVLRSNKFCRFFNLVSHCRDCLMWGFIGLAVTCQNNKKLSSLALMINKSLD